MNVSTTSCCQIPSHWDTQPCQLVTGMVIPDWLYTLSQEFQQRSLQCKSHPYGGVRQTTPRGSVRLHCTHSPCDETQVLASQPQLQTQGHSYWKPVPIGLQVKSEDCHGCSCHCCWCRCWYCKSRWDSLVKAEGPSAGCWGISVET